MKFNRLLVRSIKIFVLAVVVVGALVPAGKILYQRMIKGGKEVVSSYFSVDYVAVEFKNFYAQQVVNELRTCITQYAASKNLLSFNYQELYAQLKSRCKVIKAVDCKIEVPRAVNLVITGATPYCVVNDHWVLGDKKRLFSVDSFSDFNLTKLPRVVITGNFSEKMSQNLYAFLHKIPEDKWQQFSIMYHDTTKIELQPRYSKIPCRMLVDEESFFDDAKLRKVGAVFNDIMHRGLLTSKTLQAHEPRLTFDLRFGEHVIARCKDSFNRGVGL